MQLFQIENKIYDRNVNIYPTGDIDAYTGGLAEGPVQGGLVRFPFLSLYFKK